MGKKIVVVDDEESIVTLLEFNLKQAGYEVITAMDGQEGLNLVEKEKPDLVILDLMLPEIDGLEVCKQLRYKQIQTPILMLTAKDDELDTILGLELGADDYMTKPFSPQEVIARVKAILRRVEQSVSGQPGTLRKISVGEVDIYSDRHEAYVKGEKIDLTLKEFEILLHLIRNKGQVLAREQLLGAIWDYDFVGGTRIVDVHISHLRDKIEPNPRHPIYLKTIRGIGYKLEEPM